MTSPPRRKTLFVPGPTEVRDEVLAEMARPMIAHRHADFTALCRDVFPRLPRLFGTAKSRVMVATGSATGLMEAALRNTVKKRVLCLANGAFGERWHEIAKANGVPCGSLSAEWGRAIRGEAVKKALDAGDYDAVTLVHNETSTGLMNPLAEIAAVVRERPDTLLLVDTVSSLGGVAVDVDRHGIDVCLAGVQKAMALPPGLVLFSVSDRAFARAETVPHRGYFLDFLDYRKFHDQFSTPQTPAVSIFYALRTQLDRIEREGLEARFARHREMARLVRAFAAERFALFAEKGFESETVTCVSSAGGLDFAALSSFLAERGMAVAGGYGKLKDKTFRIAHMGDLVPEEIRALLSAIDEFAPATGRGS